MKKATINKKLALACGRKPSKTLNFCSDIKLIHEAEAKILGPAKGNHSKYWLNLYHKITGNTLPIEPCWQTLRLMANITTQQRAEHLVSHLNTNP